MINLGIDIAEEEEVVAEKMSQFLGGAESETETIVDKINQLNFEKTQLVSDLQNIRDQQQEILQKKANLHRILSNSADPTL